MHHSPHARYPGSIAGKMVSRNLVIVLFGSSVHAANIADSVATFGSRATLFDVAASTRLTTRQDHGSETCKVFPGDADWPDDEAWSTLNATVGGALFVPVPRMAACHSDWPEYDPAKCNDLLENYNNFEARSVYNINCSQPLMFTPTAEFRILQISSTHTSKATAVDRHSMLQHRAHQAATHCTSSR